MSRSPNSPSSRSSPPMTRPRRCFEAAGRYESLRYAAKDRPKRLRCRPFLHA
jgi:hypothetical protein